jgi:hypothetical protein
MQILKTRREMELELNKILNLCNFNWGMRIDKLRKIYFAVLELRGGKVD